MVIFFVFFIFYLFSFFLFFLRKELTNRARKIHRRQFFSIKVSSREGYIEGKEGRNLDSSPRWKTNSLSNCLTAGCYYQDGVTNVESRCSHLSFAHVRRERRTSSTYHRIRSFSFSLYSPSFEPTCLASIQLH